MPTVCPSSEVGHPYPCTVRGPRRPKTACPYMMRFGFNRSRAHGRPSRLTSCTTIFLARISLCTTSASAGQVSGYLAAPSALLGRDDVVKMRLRSPGAVAGLDEKQVSDRQYKADTCSRSATNTTGPEPEVPDSKPCASLAACGHRPEVRQWLLLQTSSTCASGSPNGHEEGRL